MQLNHFVRTRFSLNDVNTETFARVIVDTLLWMPCMQFCRILLCWDLTLWWMYCILLYFILLLLCWMFCVRFCSVLPMNVSSVIVNVSHLILLCTDLRLCWNVSEDVLWQLCYLTFLNLHIYTKFLCSEFGVTLFDKKNYSFRSLINDD